MRWPPPETWPHRELSRQVYAPPHRWHVQEAGTGETLILLHGAAASAHSFRDLLPKLARDHRVVALDLPGHGFTRLGARHRSGLRPMSDDLARLCEDQGWHPRAVIGHSAGGAIALRLAHILPETPHVIGLNPALSNFDGMAGVLFPALAKLLAMSPFTAAFFAQSIGWPEPVRQIIRGTGSILPPAGIELYRKLVANREHVDGTLLMMAQWSLENFDRNLSSFGVPCDFMTGAKDRAVPPNTTDRAAARLPLARVTQIADLGHLMHEEDPDRIADLILARLANPPSKTKAADPVAAFSSD